MGNTLKIVTYNLHKGKTAWGRNYCFQSLKHILEREYFDIAAFQEVLGNHENNLNQHHQIERLADQKWHEYSFAKNSSVSSFEHGNAILSKYPITKQYILDLTINQFEKRCALFNWISIEARPFVIVSTHLNLLRHSRVIQINRIINYIDENIDPDVPILLAGDFNDWTSHIEQTLLKNNFLKPKFSSGQERTFPSIFPLLKLDGIYGRNIKFDQTSRGDKDVFRQYSDHLPLFAQVHL